MAIHASKRAQLNPGASVLVFGAGAVGLLTSAISKFNGSKYVVIADVQAERVAFAMDNGFAHRGFVVPRKCGQDIHEKLEVAKGIAASAIRVKLTDEKLNSEEFDTVFECTGVESCTQAAIYVGSSNRRRKKNSDPI